MRVREDKLLKIADNFEKSLIEDGFESFFDHEQLVKAFKEIMTDYKKIVNVCKKESIDVGETNISEFKENFDDGDLSDKEDIIDKIRERVVSLMNICNNVPEKIVERYDQDLVDIIERA
ncbi:MAG: hypothetical protein ACOYO1_05195 [Bacteroidales bacterium]